MSRRLLHRLPLIPVSAREQLNRRNREIALVQLTQVGEQLMRSGSLQAAIPLFYRVLSEIGQDKVSCDKHPAGCPKWLQHPAGRRAAFLAGLCAYQLRIYDEAVWFLEAVREHEWENAHVHYNLGLLYHAAKQPVNARDSYQRALALNDEHHPALNNLGNALRELGDIEGATLCYDRLVARNPQDPHARYNLAHVLLLHGKLDRGFELYEDRWKVDSWVAEYGRRDVTTPRLERLSVPCRVFVYQEQGIGDTLQFLRYLRPLVEMGHTVTFEAPRELAPWLKRRGLEGLDGITFTARGDAVPEHDRSVPLLSLAHLLGTREESDIPPLLAPRIEARSPLYTDPRDTRDVIGFAWAGNPMHHADHHRTAPLEQIAELFTRPNTRFVSLQPGARGIELLNALPRLTLGENSVIEDVTHALTDFEHTAALVKSCKAIVTVDTSIAHLGGTLGVPTFVLTNWLSEWRWQLERTDSPWYPSVRLVRQPTLGDWPAVARETLTLLEQL